MYSKVFCVTFFAFRAPFFVFCISQNFKSGSAFMRKVKEFQGLFFSSINKTRNSHEIGKVYSECFVACFAKTFAKCEIRKVYSWLYTYRFSRFDMFVHCFVNYFVRLRTNHYTLLTLSPISFIFDSARNLSYHPLWCFVKIPIAWWERQNARWEKWLARRFMKCHLYTSRFSRFANIFSHSRQFDDNCIASL